MCDYSLHAIRNRLAVEGEQLVVHRFQSGSIGLAQPPVEVQKPRSTFWKNLLSWGIKADPCAVCIPPGATLVLYKIPTRLQAQFRVEATETVTFTQISAREREYRDAVRFSNGSTVLLQLLEPGQPIQILTLSVKETPQPALAELRA